MKLGDWKFRAFHDGRFKLDGGSMFGVVPKPLWSRERVPDEANRIELAMNVLLVEDGGLDTELALYWGTEDGGTDPSAWGASDAIADVDTVTGSATTSLRLLAAGLNAEETLKQLLRHDEGRDPEPVQPEAG